MDVRQPWPRERQARPSYRGRFAATGGGLVLVADVLIRGVGLDAGRARLNGTFTRVPSWDPLIGVYAHASLYTRLQPWCFGLGEGIPGPFRRPGRHEPQLDPSPLGRLQESRRSE